MPDLTSDITSAATSPRRVKTDAGEVESRTIEEMILADRYAKEQAAQAAKHPAAGVRITKLIPPGA